jgi:hypothetical protein
MIALALGLLAADPAAELTRVADFLTGSFSSGEQAKADPAFFDVRLRSARIWADRPGEHWLYVEQAMATALDKPYRQRVYQLVWKDGAAVSVISTLPGDPLKFAGAWEKPERFAALKPADLTERKGCAIRLTREADGRYTGTTDGCNCGSDLKGAKYATTEVTLTADTLTSWDRGFDAADKQVWGAVKGPYIFKRQPAGRAP